MSCQRQPSESTAFIRNEKQVYKLDSGIYLQTSMIWRLLHSRVTPGLDARLLPSCCCNLGICSAWCARLVQAWSWHTSHGTTAHNYHNRSRIRPCRHLFHRIHIRCYHALPLLHILHHSHHRHPWGALPLLSPLNETPVLMSETENHQWRKYWRAAR